MACVQGYDKDPDLSKTYSISNAANAAGFYNDVAWDSLARENRDITFCHAAPG